MGVTKKEEREPKGKQGMGKQTTTVHATDLDATRMNSIDAPRRNAHGAGATRRGGGTLLLAIVLLTATTGCVSNYDFGATRELPVTQRIEDLQELKDPQGDPAEGLFDITWFPLLFGKIELFIPTDVDEERVDGHFSAKMRSYLPLFCAHHVQAQHYDGKAECYEQSTLTSVLWGLWHTKEQRVATERGERVEKERRFLWLLRWGPEVRYVNRPGEEPQA